MAKQLTPDQHGRVAEKVMEWGNLVFIGLVIVQIIPGVAPFRLGAAGIGIVCLAGAYWVANRIMRGGGIR